MLKKALILSSVLLFSANLRADENLEEVKTFDLNVEVENVEDLELKKKLEISENLELNESNEAVDQI